MSGNHGGGVGNTFAGNQFSSLQPHRRLPVVTLKKTPSMLDRKNKTTFVAHNQTKGSQQLVQRSNSPGRW